MYQIKTNIYDIAKILRKKMTPAEKLPWERIRNNHLGIKIRRQEPFTFGHYRYVADFYCASLKLIIEIDGGIHYNPEIKECDQFREDIFKKAGYRIIRFNNNEVIRNIDLVLDRIKQRITS